MQLPAYLDLFVEGQECLWLDKHVWVGISLEIDDRHSSAWKKSRVSRHIISDSLEVAYDPILGQTSSKDRYIGYLKADIEPVSASLEALKKAVNSSYRFC